MIHQSLLSFRILYTLAYRMTRFAFAYLSFFIFGFGSLKGQNKWGFDTMVNTLISNDVDTISSEVLLQRLNEEKVVLFDARELAEFDVSHLHGAVYLGYDHPDYSILDQYDKDEPIVVYCSVGKRSEDIGKELEKRGFTNVYNLFGGIFDWTNRGYTVENKNGVVVKKVHPYNSTWGVWVNNYEKDYGSK